MSGTMLPVQPQQTWEEFRETLAKPMRAIGIKVIPWTMEEDWKLIYQEFVAWHHGT